MLMANRASAVIVWRYFILFSHQNRSECCQFILTVGDNKKPTEIVNGGLSVGANFALVERIGRGRCRFHFRGLRLGQFAVPRREKHHVIVVIFDREDVVYGLHIGFVKT